jgi:hypothetical protein
MVTQGLMMVVARLAAESQESNQAQTLIEAAEKASHAVKPFLNVTAPTPEQSRASRIYLNR